MNDLSQKATPGADLPASSGTPVDVKALGRQCCRWIRVFAEFGATQAVVQGLLAVAGLLIVRTLPKQEYALFVIANSMQMTCNLLADLGIGIGVRSIGGRVWSDRFRFGQLLNTALSLRGRFALFSFAFCLPLTAWMLWQNGASVLVNLTLCVAVAAGTIPLLSSSVWGTSPMLHGEYRRLQKIDLVNAVLRVLLIVGMALFWITVLLAALVGVLANWIHFLAMRRFAQEKAEFAAPTNHDDRRELVRLSLRSLPNAMFFCFQGQILILVFTALGSPTGIADFTALGRIAVFFSIFSIAFDNVVAPRFARCQDPTRLPRLYLLLVGGTILAMSSVVGLVYFLPGPFIWLLGSEYAGLQNELVWVLGAASIGQIGGVMWNLNSSKAWIRVQAHGFIIAILSAQIVSVLHLDLRQFHDVLVFNLVTASAPLVVYTCDAWLGLRALDRSSH